MAVITNYSNNLQNNYIPVNVLAVPLADPEDLIWAVGPSAPTQAGVPGSIYSSIIQDNVIPPVWYHGGNPIIDNDTLSFFGNNLIAATYNTVTVNSGMRYKGVNELRKGNQLSLASVATTVTTAFTTTSAHGLNTNDIVYIELISAIPQATGFWKVTVTGLTSFELQNYTGGGSAILDGYVQLVNYYWDEVYTTPLGSYNAVSDGSTISPFTFSIASDNSNEIKLYIEDPNIVPQTGDSLVIQKRLTQPAATGLTTDGVNSMINNYDVETYTFLVTGATWTQFPLLNAYNIPYVEYTLTLDKSFAPQIADNAYNLVLLNRTGIGVNKSLINDTWQPKEVHREQLLGDPYNYTGVLSPKGQKNYLYYEGSKFLGISSLLDGIITNTKTPYIILDFEDEIKDRLSYVVGDVEVHLPNIMINGEVGPCILSNTNAANNPLTYFVETTGVNKYAPLYLKSGADPLKRYGYVFFDLRIIVIDDAELATAIGYASKRNYTLPKLVLPNAVNLTANSGPSNRLTIVGATNANPVVITTNTQHNLQNFDKVIISDIVGNASANTPTNVYYYVSVLSSTTFELYQDTLLAIPVVGSGNYTPGTGTCYAVKMPFEYFLTYRLKGTHYKTLPYSEVIPFNFQLGGVIDQQNGQVEVTLPFLTHLVDNTNTLGYQADEWEVIIGRYVASVDNLYVAGGTTDIVYLEPQALTLFSGLNQSTSKSMTLTRAQYNAALGTYDYDIKSGDPIFSTLTALPDTLFISELKWFTGLVGYRESSEQYRMTFEFNIPQDKWNGTTNPSFVPGDSFMTSKLITEVGFFIDDSLSISNSPYIYGKISPAIKKDNASSLTIQISVDF